MASAHLKSIQSSIQFGPKCKIAAGVYFSTGEFRRIESLDTFWLSRLPVSVKAHDLEGRKLETILRTTVGREVDCAMSH